MSTNCLYAQTGRVKTVATGDWFSAGGEKGSFGYYPHLKDRRARPFYPETQLRGDLRMAADWLVSLHRTETWDRTFVAKLFGKEGGERNSLFACSDLVLDQPSAAQCRPGRFQVKPRIKIDPSTRSVERHMLVEKEMAFMDEMVLEATVRIGYCADEAELNRAASLIDKASKLSSGFGAQRSRGYGRGEVSVSWDAPVVWRSEDVPFRTLKTNRKEVVFDYFLKALTNFRNKPVALGAGQDIDAHAVVESGQIRAWFVRAYCGLFGQWPAPEQMRQIGFNPLYPALDESTSCFPPAITTMRTESAGAKFQDLWGRDRKTDDEGDNGNFFRGKSSFVGKDFFVTEEKAPRIWEPPSSVRMRNRMDEKFSTTVDGLFSQRLFFGNTWFSGQVSVADPSGEFDERALYILESLNPQVKGTWFHPRLSPATETESPSKDAFGVAVKPIPYDATAFETEFEGKDKPQFRIGVRTGFNAALGRPRRNRILETPGSVLPVKTIHQEIVYTSLTR